MVYSSSYVWAEYKFDDAFQFIKNQSLFFVIGIILMLFISKINFKFYEKNHKLIIIGCLLLLVLVLIPGIGTIRNGSRSWFGIGSFGIQPSEFSKLGMIIFSAAFLVKFDKIKNLKSIFFVLFLTLVVFILIMLQPDFGTGTIIFMSIIAMLFVAGLDIKYFVRMGFLGVGAIVLLIVTAPYRLERILSFLNPWSDPLGSGFQIIQSLYAIGPGGLFGFGLGNSRQKHFYLPEPQTDFIFAIICEELGFLGAFIVIAIFALICIIGFRIAYRCPDKFGKFLAFGIVFQLSFQAVLNLMVVVGLIPVTGVTLPFLSYGGSSLLITLCSMGIVLNISRYSK